ncbi:MAG: phytanoyl-CoA dioxygenase family protein [Pseudomonadota bacterium]
MLTTERSSETTDTRSTGALLHSTSPNTHLYDYYHDNGYVVVEKLIPEDKIDALLTVFQKDIVRSKAKFFRQNTNKYETNRLNSVDHVIQGLLDIHNYKRFPEFRQLALDIYFSEELLSALHKVTGHKQHNLMQSMMFDANTAPPPHQDCWYADTVPNGNLVGTWIALEDIQEDSGRFYVIPQSHRIALHQENMPHSEWLKLMQVYFDQNLSNVRAPEMKKGDVLFWNSHTVHGAFPTRNKLISRKSLTAHYMPSHMTFGNLFTSKPWIQYENHNGHKYFANQPEHSLKAEWISRLKVAVYNSPRFMRLARKFQKRSIADL